MINNNDLTPDDWEYEPPDKIYSGLALSEQVLFEEASIDTPKVEYERRIKELADTVEKQWWEIDYHKWVANFMTIFSLLALAFGIYREIVRQ